MSKAQTVTPEQDAFLRRMLVLAELRGYKPGWAHVRFKETFGFWHPEANLKVFIVGNHDDANENIRLASQVGGCVAAHVPDLSHGSTNGGTVNNDDNRFAQPWDDSEFGYERFTEI